MADNTTLNTGSGGDIIRTHDKGTFKVPASVIDVGGSGATESIIGDAGIFLPVEGAAAEDAAVAGNPLLMGGRYDAAARTLEAGDVGAIALDADGAVHVSDGGNSLTIDSADLTTLAGAVSGTEMQVDVVTMSPGTGATDLGKAEDAVHGSGDTGVFMLAVRRDADTSMAADGDYTGLSVSGTGALKVEVFDGGDSHTVDNAGTFAIQEDGAALTALQLLDDIVYTDDTSTHTTAVSKGAGIMAAATPTDSAVAANDIGMLAMSLDRRLHVDSQLVGQDADITIADGGNVISTDWNGTAPPIGAGTEAAALRVTIATDSTGVVSIDDNGGSLTIDGTVTANAGTNLNTSALALETGGNLATIAGAVSGTEMQVDLVAALPAGTNNIGDVDIASLPNEGQQTMANSISVAVASDQGALSINDAPTTSGGLSMYHLVSAATNNASSIKASAGQVYSVQAMNKNASPRYVKFFNKASAPVPGTDTVIKALMLPGNTSGSGMVLHWSQGLEFTTGIAVAIVAGMADSDNTAIAAEDVVLAVDYE